MIHDCIILAGGSGTRLWPASSSKRPKQFLPAPGGGTFFSASVRRALEISDPAGGRIIIVSGRSQLDLIAEACAPFSRAELERITLIPEPEGKNTAPAIACGLSYNDRVWGGAARNIMALTCDHVIEPLPVFKGAAASAGVFARQDKLVVFGISPRRPETGYGYIETGEALGAEYGEAVAFKAASFKEKPGAEQAAQYLEAGNFFWNSGIFAFSSRFMLAEFRRNACEVFEPFSRLSAPGERHYTVQNGLRILNWQGLDKAYAETKNISFDYAIAEKCGQTVMIKAGFDWIDVGNWDEYISISGSAEERDVFRKDSSSVFVDSDIPVAFIGAEDLIVVIRSGKDGGPAAALIAKKGETQKVKEIVEELKAAGRTDLT